MKPNTGNLECSEIAALPPSLGSDGAAEQGRHRTPYSEQFGCESKGYPE